MKKNKNFHLLCYLSESSDILLLSLHPPPFYSTTGPTLLTLFPILSIPRPSFPIFFPWFSPIALIIFPFLSPRGSLSLRLSLSLYSPVTWFCLLDWLCFKDTMDVHAKTGTYITLASYSVTDQEKVREKYTVMCDLQRWSIICHLVISRIWRYVFCSLFRW